VQADIPADKVREARLVRFGGRPYIVWREEAEPLVGEARGYRVRFAYPDETKWNVVTSRLRVDSPPLVASDGQQLICLYRKPGEESAARPWTLATWSRDDEDWHEAAAVTGSIPEGPVALSRQGSQFFVAVLTETGPQTAALDVATGRLDAFASPALGKPQASAPAADPNLVLILGMALLCLVLVVVSVNRARRALTTLVSPPPPAEVALAAAPILRRAVACILDNMLIALAMVPVIMRIVPEAGRLMMAGDMQVIAHLPPREAAILAGLLFMATLLYFTVLEAAWGQTLGKRLLGIRVVSDTGGPVTVWGAVVRNLLRVVDSLPSLYLVGLLFMVWSPKSQRLGDRLGHTMVVLKPAGQAAPKPPRL
jgi:uncharacterized RDD family membrane protein YckC